MSRPDPISFRLDPDKRQRAVLSRYFGVSRYAYNWVLYNNRAKPLAGAELEAAFRAAASTEAPWLAEVPDVVALTAMREAERDLAAAKRGKWRPPRYRRKEDDAVVRIEPGEDGFTLGRGGVEIPDVGRLTLIGTTARIASAPEAIQIARRGEEWSARFLVARAERGRGREGDRGQDRDRGLPEWLRGSDAVSGALPEAVTITRDGDPRSTSLGRISIPGFRDSQPVQAETTAEPTTALGEPDAPQPTTGWEALSRWIRPAAQAPA